MSCFRAGPIDGRVLEAVKHNCRAQPFDLASVQSFLDKATPKGQEVRCVCCPPRCLRAGPLRGSLPSCSRVLLAVCVELWPSLVQASAPVARVTHGSALSLPPQVLRLTDNLPAVVGCDILHPQMAACSRNSLRVFTDSWRKVRCFVPSRIAITRFLVRPCLLLYGCCVPSLFWLTRAFGLPTRSILILVPGDDGLKMQVFPVYASLTFVPLFVLRLMSFVRSPLKHGGKAVLSASRCVVALVRCRRCPSGVAVFDWLPPSVLATSRFGAL